MSAPVREGEVSRIDASWWPQSLPEAAFDALFSGGELQLGRMEFRENRFHLRVIGMLLDNEELETAMKIENRFNIDFRIRQPSWLSSGGGEVLEPYCGFSLPELGDVETLVRIVSQSQWDYVYPSPELLLTYGLMPEGRSIDAGIVYRYPDEPRTGTVRVGPSSRRAGWGGPSSALSYVSSDADLVQDYCTVRNKHFVVAYFLHCIEPVERVTDEFLGDTRGWVSTSRPGRHVSMCRLGYGRADDVKIEIWGLRGPIRSPGERPLSDDSWDYSDFTWPEGTGDSEDGFVGDVYVQDTVLARYLEEGDKYDVNPVSGSVGLGYQWTVVTHGRRGRDAIAVDLKRLNEGTSRSVARHWHQHAVAEPPQATWAELNIASRTLKAVAALQRLARALSGLAGEVTTEAILPLELLMWNESDDQWPESLLRAAAPAARGMSESDFLVRAQWLYDAIIAPISERQVRRILAHLAPEIAQLESVKGFKSISLLRLLSQMSRAAYDTGLRLPDDVRIVLGRLGWTSGTLDGAGTDAEVAVLQLVNKIRNEQAHAGARAADLSSLGAEPRRAVTAWGEVLDRLYDQVSESLNALAELIGAVQ